MSDIELFEGISSININKNKKEIRKLKKIFLDEDFYVYFKPDFVAGGDSYDIYNNKDGTFYLSVSDVEGHNVDSAIVSSLFQDQLQNLYKRSISPDQIAQQLNNMTVEGVHSSIITLWISKIDINSKEIQYCSCGAYPPIIIREGIASELKAKNSILGIKDANFKLEKFKFNKNDIIFIFTDGLVEARKRSGEFLEYDSLIDYLEENYKKTPKEIVQQLVEKLKSKFILKDDITILCIRL